MKVEQPGVNAFTELSDVPHSYLGEAEKHLAVNILETGIDFVDGGGGGDVSVSYETVSKNLSAVDATLTYTGENLTSIAYVSGVTKTLTYTGENLTSITLSGSTPSGIDLIKTLTYTGENLTGITYS
jgi:hypothetical protein